MRAAGERAQETSPARRSALSRVRRTRACAVPQPTRRQPAGGGKCEGIWISGAGHAGPLQGLWQLLLGTLGCTGFPGLPKREILHRNPPPTALHASEGARTSLTAAPSAPAITPLTSLQLRRNETAPCLCSAKQFSHVLPRLLQGWEADTHFRKPTLRPQRPLGRLSILPPPERRDKAGGHCKARK